MRSCLVSVAVLVVPLGCEGRQSVTGAAAIPGEVDMPVGFRHDVLLAACERRSSLAGILAPNVLLAVFSAEAGRLDVLLGIPGATLDAVLEGPQLGGCVPIDFEVGEVTLAGVEGWTVERTDSPYALRVLAGSAGEATLEARSEAEGASLVARSTLRAHAITSVTFDPLCDVASSVPPARVWIPAGGRVGFWQRVLGGEVPLVGYGPAVVELGDRLTPVGATPAAVIDGVARWSAAVIDVAVAPETGPITLTSSFDPAYVQHLEVYDAGMIDGLRAEVGTIVLFETAKEDVVAGARVEVLVVPTIGGEDVCRAEALRLVTIDTPAVCSFAEADVGGEVSAESRSRITLMADAPGTCRLQATVAGSAVGTWLEFEVGAAP